MDERQQGISKLEWHEKRGSIAALSSLALFHNEDVFTTLPGSLLYSIKIKFSIIFLSASHVSYNDVYVDDYFQMEMVVNVKRMRMRCKHVDDVSLHTYIHTYIHKYSDFLVTMISVGLAQARPNYYYSSLNYLYQVFSNSNHEARARGVHCTIRDTYLGRVDLHPELGGGGGGGRVA